MSNVQINGGASLTLGMNARPPAPGEVTAELEARGSVEVRGGGPAVPPAKGGEFIAQTPPQKNPVQQAPAQEGATMCLPQQRQNEVPTKKGGGPGQLPNQSTKQCHEGTGLIGCHTPKQAGKVAQGGGAPATTYTVAKGDNLSKIAAKYGTTWQQLYAANRDQIKNPDLIYPGQVLKVPGHCGDDAPVQKSKGKDCAPSKAAPEKCDTPPVKTPPKQETPKQEHCDTPPVKTPPTQTPPKQEPPVCDTPPVKTPPSKTPPVQQEPPTKVPPIHVPPVKTPPVQQEPPSKAQPPVQQTPSVPTKIVDPAPPKTETPKQDAPVKQAPPKTDTPKQDAPVKQEAPVQQQPVQQDTIVTAPEQVGSGSSSTIDLGDLPAPSGADVDAPPTTDPGEVPAGSTPPAPAAGDLPPLLPS